MEGRFLIFSLNLGYLPVLAGKVTCQFWQHCQFWQDILVFKIKQAAFRPLIFILCWLISFK